jgi:hypothetical protein
VPLNLLQTNDKIASGNVIGLFLNPGFLAGYQTTSLEFLEAVIFRGVKLFLISKDSSRIIDVLTLEMSEICLHKSSRGKYAF